jgi:hypothetical protein
MEQLLYYATGVEGVVEIESKWTGRKRERMGMPLRLEIVGKSITFGDRSTDSSGPILSPKAGEKDRALAFSLGKRNGTLVASRRG